jgi:hypothetical protein
MPNAPIQAIKQAPVTTLSTAEALTAAVLTFLVTHQIIGNVDVSATTQTIAPFIALALPAVFGAAKWALVSPYSKVKHLAEKDGLVSDADFARLEALLDTKLTEVNSEADAAVTELTDARHAADAADDTAADDIPADDTVDEDTADEDDDPTVSVTNPPPGMGAGGADGIAA